METKLLPVSGLKPAPYNPRKALKPGDKAYEKLKKSIMEFGLVQPIVVNERTGHVVGGHQRLQVLIDSGADEADCIIVNLTPEKEKALNLALNKVGGEWDVPALKDLMLDLSGDTYCMELTGFDVAEIDAMIGPPPVETFERPEDKSGYKEQYGIIIRCEDEAEQERLFNRLQADGYNCRVVAT